MKRIRIQTADTDETTVKELGELAHINSRSLSREALLAIEHHINRNRKKLEEGIYIRSKKP